MDNVAENKPDPAELPSNHAPVKATLPTAPIEPEQGRRKFFARALGEVLSPFAGLIHAKIDPILKAIDTLPDEADRVVAKLGAHDDVHLPIALKPEHILRPPGALAEEDFKALCSHCGICVNVCPAHAITMDSTEAIGGGYPYIVARQAPCVVCDSLACMNNCPSGALKLVEKLQIDMGLAKVNHNTCLRHHGEDCRLCVEICPLETTAITVSAESGKIIVKRDGCIGCGLCEQACPTEPSSIVVMPTKPRVESMEG